MMTTVFRSMDYWDRMAEEASALEFVCDCITKHCSAVDIDELVSHCNDGVSGIACDVEKRAIKVWGWRCGAPVSLIVSAVTGRVLADYNAERDCD